ncbi:hypothetical protein CLAFUW4_06336 [Fulvia fulva]|uniref:Uncharacterized protein n=1 Tax=Passalora fulva TaxID=5499 RepID=A0A9Q8LHF9_PASFU|nr:uncharacterized protein CLAFUR5_06480 [Fulvia fulva]KAK4624428.1 hypothetical protein CLAFUR4_06339 [Fulvia fulva]KAK4625877.1 hypothetical protein CLAFUR0_06341 [Fulvia fulva]UJO17501.1 hypothetical protein CLAFUR5_06480 [Fulvia fulva]WPV15004.1 hypothetical protein CLAFUW4_06336 [Fulvia fulva]WPV29601.1 hypothetical protein CLAFUW7_06334 [Fulvia fulva]
MAIRYKAATALFSPHKLEPLEPELAGSLKKQQDDETRELAGDEAQTEQSKRREPEEVVLRWSQRFDTFEELAGGHDRPLRLRKYIPSDRGLCQPDELGHTEWGSTGYD